MKMAGLMSFLMLFMLPSSLLASSSTEATSLSTTLQEIKEKAVAADFENMSKRDQRRFLRQNLRAVTQQVSIQSLNKDQSSLSPQMRRGIILIIVGIVIATVGGVFGRAPGGWPLYWLLYLVGSILVLYGGLLILLDLLDSI